MAAHVSELKATGVALVFKNISRVVKVTAARPALNTRQVTEPAGNPGYAGPALQISALALPPMVSIAIVVKVKMLFILFMVSPSIRRPTFTRWTPVFE